MPWKLIEVPENEDGTLTDANLVSLNIAMKLAANRGDPGDPGDTVFARIWAKLRPQVDKAIENGLDE
jgi:hypothetical protein